MKKRKNITIKISNKLVYTLIVFGILAIVAVGLYAYGTSSPSDMGHSLGELDLPSCDEGEALAIFRGHWDCLPVTAGGTSIWSQSGDDIYYDEGNVGIGTSTPSATLEVNDLIKSGRVQIKGGGSSAVIGDSCSQSQWGEIRRCQDGGGTDLAKICTCAGTNGMSTWKWKDMTI